jgi:hypothetical protein
MADVPRAVAEPRRKASVMATFSGVAAASSRVCCMLVIVITVSMSAKKQSVRDQKESYTVQQERNEIL